MKLEMDTESQFTICCIVDSSYRFDKITEVIKSGADSINIACAIDGRCPISSAQPGIYQEDKQP